MPRCYPAIKFVKTDKRTYTYHADIDLEIGDMVDVEGKGGKPISVEVVAIEFAKPPFVTKGIIGKSAPKGELPLQGGE